MINCPDILAPADEDLISLVYDEGVLSAQEKAHFDQCPICQRRLATYSDMNHTLLAKLHRCLCPSAVRLNYYCLAMVSDEERVNIASHLRDCPRCTDEIAEIRSVLATFEPFPTVRPSLGSTIRRIVATLVVQQAKPVLVTRGETLATGWPRQYQAEMLDLSLHVSRQANGETMLLGILTSSDPAATVDTFEGVKAELYTAPGPLKAQADKSIPLLIAQVDEIGNLLLEPVPAGEYTMILRLPDQEIVIEGLKI